MNSLIYLISMIGVEKTLIVASGQYALRDYVELSDEVAFFFLPENMLNRYDVAERERLKSTIAKSGCTQLVFLGLHDEEMRCRLAYQSSYHAIRSGLRFKTALLPKDARIMGPIQLSNTLLDHHVATQCAYMMEFPFIRDMVKKGRLTVRGIVGTSDSEGYKDVFYNGIRFNDLVSMN